MKAKETKPYPSEPGKHGFTLIELIVVIAVLAVLAIMLLPAYGEARTKSRHLRCMDNMRQVMNAALMYTHDYRDWFPPNPDDGGASAQRYTWAWGDVAGGMPNDQPPAPQTYNTDVATNNNFSLLLRYVGGDPSVFRCTADTRVGAYNGTDLTKFGTKVPAIRSISMSQAVGSIDACWKVHSGHCQGQSYPVDGPWLTGNNGANQHNNPWRTYGSITDMLIPGPASTWVFIEEDPYSINDAGFAFSAAIPKWVDFPSTRHNMACVINFGDGHVELHKWRNMGMRLTAHASAQLAVTATDADWLWLRARTTASAQ